MPQPLESIDRITENGVVAVIRKVPADKVVAVAESLIQGGINALEVTLDSEDALQTITKLQRTFKGQAIIGAGTVLDDMSARLAIQHGAAFIVSPILSQSVIQTTLRYGKVCVSGAYTPTEMFQAVEWGAHIVKLFPASVGGPDFIKNVRGPLPHIPIIPTGGMHLDHVGDFIKAGAIAVGTGSHLVNNDRIKAGQFDLITETARKYVTAVREARQRM